MKTFPAIDRLVAEINAERAEECAEWEVSARAESDAIESGRSPDDASVIGMAAVFRYREAKGLDPWPKPRRRFRRDLAQ